MGNRVFHGGPQDPTRLAGDRTDGTLKEGAVQVVRDERVLLDRVDGLDVEPGHGLYEGQPGL